MSYIPEWSGVIEGYVVNYLKKNTWRIARTHDYDDAMQECHLVFLRCASSYPVLDTPQHFMALFKTTLKNEFIDLAHKATLARNCILESSDTDEDVNAFCRDLIGETNNAGYLATMVRQAPVEVVMVLNLFLNAPQEVLALAMDVWRRRGKLSADGDKAVAQMLGLPASAKPMSSTLRYFSDGD